MLGETEREKSGNARVTNAGCVWIPPALVPTTVSIRVPAGVELVVVTVNVDVSDPETDVGLKLAVTPVGLPNMVADNATVPANPFPAASETEVLMGAPPGVRFNVLGEAASVK